MKLTKYVFFFVTIFSGSLCAAEIQGKVIRVLDGDTIEVKTLPAKIVVYEVPIRVRLINIDALEKKQAFGRWSANQLKNGVTSFCPEKKAFYFTLFSLND